MQAAKLACSGRSRSKGTLEFRLGWGELGSTVRLRRQAASTGKQEVIGTVGGVTCEIRLWREMGLGGGEVSQGPAYIEWQL